MVGGTLRQPRENWGKTKENDGAPSDNLRKSDDIQWENTLRKL
jgi:hypothetical protein